MQVKPYLEIAKQLLTGKWREARANALKRYYFQLQKYYRARKPLGVDIVAEPWDFLIILDACRYEQFEEIYSNYLPGEVEKRKSRGTSTSQWLRENFMSMHDDIVYVSANPQCSDHEINGYRGSDHFHHVEHVWKHGWNEELNTVTPDVLRREALRVAYQFPQKRYIIHFVQPHIPWIGETRLAYNRPPKEREDDYWNIGREIDFIMQGRVSDEFMRQAAFDNLKLVLGEVQQLVDQISGRVIITADHGESLGEYLIYGHPPGIYTRQLVEIPWLLIDKGERTPLVVTGDAHASREPGIQESGVDDKIEERLKALGYLD